MRIGFIGTGIMGKPMILHLIKAGYEVYIYARNKSKCEDLITQGAVFHNTIADCVKSCDVVITIVGYPKDVEEVYLSEEGIMNSSKQGAYLIDMTTSSPTLAKQLYQEGQARGLHVLDAPVTGGKSGAEKGTLSVLVGGEKEDYEACLPIFQVVGANIRYQGKVGSGQHAKLANQIMIAGTLAGICEAFTYAKSEGLDLQTLFDSISSGAAASYQLNSAGPQIIKGDYSPTFFLKHFIKDMSLASKEAEGQNLNLDVLNQVLANGRTLEEEYGDLGTQALMKYYDKNDKMK